MSKCICCKKNEVTWPKVCDDCIDHEAQAELAREYSYNMTCKICGMIHDGGQCCTYCGDRDPLDEGGRMILVIAGNSRQYLDYLQKNNMNRRDAIYANSEKDLMGYDLRKTKIVLTGEYWLNSVYNSKFHSLIRELQPGNGE